MPITLNGTTGEVFPSWTTGTRPSSPVAGQTGYNTTLRVLETYNSTTTTWVVAGSNPQITQTIYTSGSGTYTVPTGVTWLRVRMVGGGGGGGGSGSAGGGVGAAGGNTTFGSSFLTANGAPAQTLINVPVVGGTASIGAGATGIAITGAPGAAGVYASSTGSFSQGGVGGSSPFGGAGSPDWPVRGNSFSASANSGSGGGGASPAVSGAIITGAGGAAGGYIDCIISSPSSSYSYAVGAGGTAGTAGTSGYAGGAGGSGVIIIEEHYNW